MPSAWIVDAFVIATDRYLSTIPLADQLMFQAADGLVEEVLARIALRHVRDEKVADCGAPSEYQQRMIESLTQSAQGIFETMCGFGVQPSGITHTSSHRAQHDLNGIISISGKVKVTLVLSLTKELAFGAVRAFLGAAPEQVNSEVIDVVGELTNMICGNAKERIAIDGLSLGLPTVVAGSSMIVAFESGLKISQIDFTSEHGEMSILFGIR